MKKSEWDDKLKGFYIIDCAIKNEDVAYLFMVEYDESDDNNTLWRVISWAPSIIQERDKSDDSLRVMEVENIGPIPSIEVQRKPEVKAVLCDRRGQCYVAGEGWEEAPGLGKMRTLWGEVHVANNAGIFKRDGAKREWSRVGKPPQMTADQATGKRLKYYVKDFDAYSPDEFYLLSGDGTLFYTDKGVWKDVDLKKAGYPEAMTGAMCCGPDGYVYVFARGAKGSRIFQGRKDKWKIIWSEPFGGIFPIDMLAYQDYVLISNSAMLAKIKDGEITPLDAPFGGRYLSVHENLLMIASDAEAAIFNGKEWKMIVSPHFNEDGVYERTPFTLTDTEAEVLEKVSYLESDAAAERLDKALDAIDSFDEDEMKAFSEVLTKKISKNKSNKGR